ncbi:MAG TPA: hypothetical protein VJU18_15645, partial [Vicinamibacteria bacterium]|nr:hypothetical protein [Vicinamibacteria bacterium]
PVVGNPLASGTALRNAYDAVVASPEAPILLKLEPGAYDVGSTPFALSKPDVHLEGSGRDLTTITGSGFVVMLLNVNLTDANINLSRLSVRNNSGDGLTVLGGRVDLAEVRVTTTKDTASGFVSGVTYAFGATGSFKNVIVEATNASGYAQGLSLNNQTPGASPFVVDDVVVTASAGSYARGVQVGSSASMNNLRVRGSWNGLEVIATNPTPPVIAITNSRIEGGSAGLVTGSSGSSTITVQGSSVVGGSASVLFDSISSAQARIAQTLLSGPAFNSPPNTLTCLGAYNAAFQPLDASCQ